MEPALLQAIGELWDAVKAICPVHLGSARKVPDHSTLHREDQESLSSVTLVQPKKNCQQMSETSFE
jgi:hypothetical protein